VEALTSEIEKRAPEAEELGHQARHLRTLLRPSAPQSLVAVPADQKQVGISGLQFVEQSVGWGRPLRDQVLLEGTATCFLQVDGRFHDRGLFAHAPSKYVLDLQDGWNRFTSGYGLQDGHSGSVIFVLRGNGRELFRSERITDHRLHSMDLEVSGINRLELVVEDAGDCPNWFWGHPARFRTGPQWGYSPLNPAQAPRFPAEHLRFPARPLTVPALAQHLRFPAHPPLAVPALAAPCPSLYPLYTPCIPHVSPL